MAKKRIYRVTFLNEGKVYEVYCSRVAQSELFGFIEIEGFLFGEKSSAIVDPSEESLKTEFAGVPRTHVPLASIVRIDEVEKRGTGNIRAASDKDKVRPIHSPLIQPGKRGK